MSLEEFASRYRFIVSSRVEWVDLRELCQAIVNSHGPMKEEIRIGHKLVYATENGIDLVEQRKQMTRNHMASVVQRWWRQIIRRRRAAQAIQQWWRLVLRRKAAVRLQTWWRNKKNAELILLKLQHLSRSIRLVQRSVRKWFHIKQHRKMLLQRKEELERSLANDQEPEQADESQTIQQVRPVEEQVTAEKVEKAEVIQSAKPALLPGVLLLELARFNYFYSDGIVSVRRPLTVTITIRSFQKFNQRISFDKGSSEVLYEENLFAFLLRPTQITTAFRTIGRLVKLTNY